MAEPEPGQVAPALLRWWRVHGRKDLPWQQNATPYRVWVSEIMLQQTQVNTVLGYYDRFMAAFPDVARLAAAPVDEVLHLWSGLGYYARARNLHRAAGQVMTDFHGELPEQPELLQSLPGIGRSTAGAILALSRGRRCAILDGNAKRVLARYFGVTGWPGRAAVTKQLWSLAEACTPDARVDNYTQAIMDLGASVCVRGKANCKACPLAEKCIARATGQVAEIPRRAPKRHRPRRETLALLVARPDGAVLLQRRPAEGIWGGLWGLPEATRLEEVESWCVRQLGCSPRKVERRPAVQHGFTHFDLDIHPVLVRVDGRAGAAMDDDSWLWYNRLDPAQVGLAAPVARLLTTLGEDS